MKRPSYIAPVTQYNSQQVAEIENGPHPNQNFRREFENDRFSKRLSKIQSLSKLSSVGEVSSAMLLGYLQAELAQSFS
jgi:hypothetical protein